MVLNPVPCGFPVQCPHVNVAVVYCCTHSNKNLCAAMHDFDVLVVHEAAHDSDVGVALCAVDPWSLWHLCSHTARTMFTPPGVMGRDVKCQQITVLEDKENVNFYVGRMLFFYDAQ